MTEKQKYQPLEDILQCIRNMDFKHCSNLEEKTSFSKILKAYPRSNLPFRDKRNFDYDYWNDDEFVYIDSSSRETENTIHQTLEALDIPLSKFAKSAFILQLLLYLYEEVQKDVKSTEFNYYFDPFLILGHNFISMSDNLKEKLDNSSRKILSHIEVFYHSCTKILEDVMSVYPEENLVFTNQQDQSVQFFHDSIDLFLVLIMVYWLIIFDQEKISEYTIYLRQFLHDFLRFENSSRNINYYLKSKFRYELETRFIQSEIVPKENLEKLDLSSYDESNITEIFELYGQETEILHKIQIVQYLESFDSPEVTNFLFSNLENKDKLLSDKFLNLILKKKLEPKDLRNKILLFGKLSQWDDIAKLQTEESTMYLIEKFKQLKHDYKKVDFDLSNIRVSILKALSQIQNKEVLDLIIEAIEEKDLSVQWAAIEQLGINGSDEAVDYLLMLAQREEKKDKINRYFAERICKSLALSNSEKAIDYLFEQIENNRRLKYYSINHLGLSKNERVVDFLIDLADKAHEKGFMERIIRNLSATENPKAIDKVRDIVKASSSQTALDSLGSKSDKKSRDLLKKKIIESESSKERIKAISAFRWKYDEKKAEILFEIYDKMGLDEKLEIAFTLGSMQGKWKPEHIEKRFKILRDLLDTVSNPSQLKTLFLGIGYSGEGRLYPKFKEVIERPYTKNVRNVINFRMNRDMAHRNLLKAHNKLVASTPLAADQAIEKGSLILEQESHKNNKANDSNQKISVLTEEQEQRIESQFIANIERTLDLKLTGKLMKIFDKNPDSRHTIRFILRRLADKATLDELRNLISDQNEDVKSGGVVLTIMKREKQLFQKVKEIIVDENESIRIRLYALELLKQIKPNEALPILEKCLNDENKEIRLQAVKETLDIFNYKHKELPGIISDKKAVGVELICDAFQEGILSAFDLPYAKDHIVKIGVEAISFLAKTINKTSDKDLLTFMAYTLGEFESKEAIDPLLILIKNENKSVREFAVNSLIKIGDKSALKQLIQIAENPEEEKSVRSNALRGIGDLGSEKNFTLLEKFLNDSDYTISSAYAIGKIGNKKALNTLINKFESISDIKLKHTLVSAIGQINTPESLQFIKKIAEDKQSQLRNSSFAVLRAFKSNASFEILEKVISDDEETDQIRLDALKFLEKITDDINISMLKRLTNLENEKIVEEVNRILKLINRKLKSEKQEEEK